MITIELKIAILIAVSYFIYAALIKKNINNTELRVYLLLSSLLAFFIPFIIILFPQKVVLTTIYIPEVAVNSYQSIANNNSGLNLLTWLEIIYLVGLLIITIFYIVAIFRIFNYRHNTKSIDGIVYVNKNISPFSFLNTIYLPQKLKNTEEVDIIIRHEKAHITLFHSIDIIFFTLLAIFQWFNPFAWLMLKAIKELHEYQADESTIKSGIAVDSYCNQVIANSLGCQLNVLVNNFNKNLTLKRLAMITNKRISKWSKLWIAIIVPIVMIIFSSIILINCQYNHKKNDSNYHGLIPVPPVPPAPPAPPAIVKQNSNIQLPDVFDSKGEKANVIVDENSKFQNGDINNFRQYIQKQMKYPEEAIKKQIQGKVILQFIVNSVGNVEHVTVLRSVNPLLDAEARRVLENSPAWTPAKINNKNVSQVMVIPIMFSLDK